MDQLMLQTWKKEKLFFYFILPTTFYVPSLLLCFNILLPRLFATFQVDAHSRQCALINYIFASLKIRQRNEYLLIIFTVHAQHNDLGRMIKRSRFESSQGMVENSNYDSLVFSRNSSFFLRLIYFSFEYLSLYLYNSTYMFNSYHCICVNKFLQLLEQQKQTVSC